MRSEVQFFFSSPLLNKLLASLGASGIRPAPQGLKELAAVIRCRFSHATSGKGTLCSPRPAFPQLRDSLRNVPGEDSAKQANPSSRGEDFGCASAAASVLAVPVSAGSRVVPRGSAPPGAARLGPLPQTADSFAVRVEGQAATKAKG